MVPTGRAPQNNTISAPFQTRPTWPATHDGFSTTRPDRGGDLVASSTPQTGAFGDRWTADPLPMPLLASAAPDTGISYFLSRVDASGSCAAKVALTELGWHPGHPIQYRVESNIVTVHGLDTGLHTVPKKYSLILPVTVRRLCGITKGDELLLAAIREHDTLLIYPRTVINAMIEMYYRSLPESS